MKSLLAHGTASVALMVSLMGTAHAQTIDAEALMDAEAQEQEVFLSADDVLVSIAVDEDARDDGAFEVSSDLLASFEAIDGRDAQPALSLTSAPATTEAMQSGVVTTRAIQPHYRDINPFYGDINPFYRDIVAFWGDINPFYRDIVAFNGNGNANGHGNGNGNANGQGNGNGANPFYRDINPFYGDIVAFWGDINPFYRDIVAFDESELEAIGNFWQAQNEQIEATEQLFNGISYHSNGAIVRDGTPGRAQASLRELVAQGEAQFGANYTERTGNSFDTLVDEIFARHGANIDQLSSLEALTSGQRAALYLDWHDTLNQYSGIDAVDHWMAAINWTPSITQIQGDGREAVIGIIDGNFSSDADLGNNVVYAGGHRGTVNGHGAGVASLIAGAHDGEGVMGISPNINIATYNPFDETGSASWDDVLDGIIDIQNRFFDVPNDYGWAAIMNLSLGEPGFAVSQGLADTLARPEISWIYRDTVFVIAAGNEGITQTTDIEWNHDQSIPFILVGSIDPFGEISDFSNRPGDACLLDNGVCHAGNELYMRTVVAPGELLLVSDGQGGVVRRSGTSFSAPLVSGAVALLHDRWPWLVLNPETTADIIFQSAQDLGAPGPDQIYGHGLLDVEASQSPLDFNNLTFTLYQDFGNREVATPMSAATLANTALPRSWNTDDVYFTAIENLGTTFRDFVFPASILQRGRSNRVLGRYERFQDFITKRFTRWMESGGKNKNGNGNGNGFTELRSDDREISGQWTLRYDAMAPQYTEQGEMRMVHGAATLTEPSGALSLTMGHGQGGMALSGYRFGIQSDHDAFTGGVNPILGLASGDTFMQLGYQITPNTKVSVGFSENREEWDDVTNQTDPLEVAERQAFGDRPASAFTLDIEQRVSDDFSINAQYTRLNEVNALLGTQTATAALLGGGSQTEAMTVSASLDVGHGISFDVSATGARTETSREQLFTNSGAIWSTSAQFSATKRGIFSDRDTLRVSVAQPMQVEDGTLQLTSEEVVDRLTGERAPVTQTFSIETERRITTEAVYAAPLTNSSELGVFSRYVSAGDTFNEAGLVVGGNFSLRF